MQKCQCRTCGESPEAHFYYYAHHNKQLSIRVRRLTSGKHLAGEGEGKIWMWGRCGQCRPGNKILKTMKRVLVSTAAHGLSFGKFLELSLSHHSLSPRLSSCGHSFQSDFLIFFGYAEFGHSLSHLSHLENNYMSQGLFWLIRALPSFKAF